MPYFDRFDIVEAHYLFCSDYHGGQTSALYARFSQLVRMQFKPAPNLSFETLTENGKFIYNELEIKHGFAETYWMGDE